jgi:hypothetical protein
VVAQLQRHEQLPEAIVESGLERLDDVAQHLGKAVDFGSLVAANERCM